MRGGLFFSHPRRILRQARSRYFGITSYLLFLPIVQVSPARSAAYGTYNVPTSPEARNLNVPWDHPRQCQVPPRVLAKVRYNYMIHNTVLHNNYGGGHSPQSPDLPG